MSFVAKEVRIIVCMVMVLLAGCSSGAVDIEKDFKAGEGAASDFNALEFSSADILAHDSQSIAVSDGDASGEVLKDASPKTDISTTFIDWSKLKNPILEEPDRLLKDPCVVYHDGWFYIYTHRNYRTKDFIKYEPIPSTGSQPDVTWSGSHWVMAKNGGPLASWTKSDSAAPLLLTSSDLKTWTKPVQLLPGLTEERNIDPALAWEGDWVYIGFKREQKFHITRVKPKDLGTNHYEQIKTASAGGSWAEQFQLIKIDGAWHLVATAYRYGIGDLINLGLHPYTGNHHPFIYTRADTGPELEKWTKWVNRRELNIPVEDWNTAMHANGGYLVDWRAHDGYFYLFYAGSKDHTSFDKRGHDKIGVARSKDLKTWVVAGDTGELHLKI